jgi:hypothetical protein
MVGAPWLCGIFARMDSRAVLAAAIIFATLIGAWMFRYETYREILHRNRFTGAVCRVTVECWFSSDRNLI